MERCREAEERRKRNRERDMKRNKEVDYDRRDADRDVMRSGDKYRGTDNVYWMEGYDNRNGRGSDTMYVRNQREKSGDRRLRERSRTGTQSPRTTMGRSRERSDQRVQERSRTGTQSPRVSRVDQEQVSDQ